MFKEPNNNTVAIAFKRNPKGKSKHSHISCWNRKTEHPPKSDIHYSIMLKNTQLCSYHKSQIRKCISKATASQETDKKINIMVHEEDLLDTLQSLS